jgi:tetratricopeptide (TPR) repeat protein
MKQVTLFVVPLMLALFAFGADANSAAAAYDAKNWSSAVNLYKGLTESEPQNALYWFRLGYVSRQLGQLAEAKTALNKASELGFQPMYIGLNLAAVEVLSGERASALDRIEKLASNGAPLAGAIEGDSAFRSVSNEPRFVKAIESMKEQAAPCTYRTKNPEYRQFDFWVGAWDVFGKAGQKSGTSRVELILGDCVINENWTDSVGGQGKSYNKYNAPLKRWEQYWVDQYGSTTYYVGNLEGSNMVFLADSVDAAGKPAKLRMTFFPLPEGKVRQFGETSSDGGKTWTTSFDLTYARRK